MRQIWHYNSFQTAALISRGLEWVALGQDHQSPTGLPSQCADVPRYVHMQASAMHRCVRTERAMGVLRD